MEKKTRAPRKPKTAAEIKLQMEKLKAQLAIVEQEEHAEQLSEMLTKHNVVSAINEIQAMLDVDELVMLRAIGKELKIPRLSITQSEAIKRSPKHSK